jgi:hypothetical protein
VGQSPRHQATHSRVDEDLRALRQTLVIHRLILLFCPNQEKVRSTTQRFGKNGLGPSGGKNFFGSSFTPSLAHSLTHLIITSSGAGLGGCLTISAVQPSVLSTQPAPLSWPVV